MKVHTCLEDTKKKSRIGHTKNAMLKRKVTFKN